jgi:hypothetical protein
LFYDVNNYFGSGDPSSIAAHCCRCRMAKKPKTGIELRTSATRISAPGQTAGSAATGRPNDGDLFAHAAFDVIVRGQLFRYHEGRVEVSALQTNRRAGDFRSGPMPGIRKVNYHDLSLQG